MKPFSAVFQSRFRGFRIIDLCAFACLTTLVLGVYAFKAHAGGVSAKSADVESQIADEQRRIRLLQADIAQLEQPERLERLSTQYLGLAPVAAKHETTPSSLMEIAREGDEPAVGAAKTPTAKTPTAKSLAAKTPAVAGAAASRPIASADATTAARIGAPQ